MVLVVIVATSYAIACAVIQARTVPTLKAVTRWDNFTGLGNVPAFTLRHKVGALNGTTAALPAVARFGPLPLALFFSACSAVTGGDPMSCDTRTYALSDSASKTDV
jgi:hypothetical protein